METQIRPNLVNYIVQTQMLGSKTPLKEVLFKYLDGAIKWAMKELKTLELYNNFAQNVKLNARV